MSSLRWWFPALLSALLAGAVATTPRVAALLVVCLLAAVLTLFRGGFGVALAFAFLAPSSALKFGQLTASDLAMAAALVGAALAAALGEHRPPRLPWWLWLPPVGVFAVGATFVVALGNPLAGLVVFAAAMGLVPLTLVLHGGTERRLELLFSAFVLGVVVNCLVATYDAVIPGPSPFSAVLSARDYTDIRPAGLTTHSNQLGLLCAFAVPLAAHLADKSSRRWWLAFAAVCVGAAATGSRGALVGVALGAVLYLVLQRGWTWRLPALAGVGMVAVWLAVRLDFLSVGLERLTGSDTYSASATQSDLQREIRAQNALEAFSDHTWTGVGFTTSSAINFYLEVGRSGGIFILLFVVTGLVAALMTCWRLRPHVPAATATFVVVGLWLVLAAQHNATTARFIWVPAGLAGACWAISRKRAFDTEVLTPCPASDLSVDGGLAEAPSDSEQTAASTPLGAGRLARAAVSGAKDPIWRALVTRVRPPGAEPGSAGPTEPAARRSPRR